MSVKSMHEALMEMAQNQLDEAVSVEKKGRMIVVKDGKSNTFPLHSEEQAMIKKLKDGQTVKFKDETGTEVTAARKGDMVHLSNKMSNKKTPVAYSNFNESFERAAWVPESIADEQVEAFMEAALAAVQEGKDTFVFEAKHYKAKSKKEAKKLDPVGKADADIDNDGDVDSSDEYLHKRRKAIKKAMDEEVEIGGTTYQHMDLCPAAVKQFKSDLEKGDNPKVRAAMKAVDAYLGVEAAAKEKGSATQADVDKMEALIATAKGKISDAGLSGHDYHQAHLDAVKDMMGKEKMDEAAAAGSTAQHGPDTATSDSYDKQLATRGGEKEFTDKHTTEVAYDVEELYKKNQEEAEAALKKTPGRLGDQTKGDTSFVNPLKAEIIDGITAALAKMKTNS